MPLNISTEAIYAKNRLISNGAWLILLEIAYPDEDQPIRVCWNNEDIEWDGKTWLGCQFSIGELNESKDGEIPSVDLNVVDIQRKLIPTVDEYDGGTGAIITMIHIHTDNLDSGIPELEETFEIISTSMDHKGTVTFTLGAENFTNYRSPSDRYLKNHCRYKVFGGARCGYDGPETECDRTFERCKELGNQRRFGGHPGIGRLGYYA